MTQPFNPEPDISQPLKPTAGTPPPATEIEAVLISEGDYERRRKQRQEEYDEFLQTVERMNNRGRQGEMVMAFIFGAGIGGSLFGVAIAVFEFL